MYGDLMHEVMDRAVANMPDLPARKQVAPGFEVAWDCEQFWVRLISATPIYQPNSNCPVQLNLVLGVGLIRCVEGLGSRGSLPSPEALTEDGRSGANELYELMTHLMNYDFASKRVLHSKIGLLTALGPMGGYAGGEWELQVRMTL